MLLEINKTLTNSEISQCEYLSSYGLYQLYVYYDYETFLIAVDDSNLICGCFEFSESEGIYKLAHMNVIKSLKRNGIGTAIISKAIELFEWFELPSTNSDDMYYYIDDGLNFIHHCFDIGVLKEPPFVRPDYVVI